MVASIIYNVSLLSPRIKLFTSWAFYMEGKRLFEGNRTLVTNYNLYLPILNGFKLFEKLKTNKFSIEINTTNIPLNGICTFDENNFDIQLLLFSHIDDYTINQNENVIIVLNNIKLKYVLVKHYRIDSNNNNIYSEWIKMGKPDHLNHQQLEYFQNYQQLKLFNTPILYQIENNKLTLGSINISTHSIDFFEIVNLD
jgi:beta-xylosidase